MDPQFAHDLQAISSEFKGRHEKGVKWRSQSRKSARNVFV